jgi:hypothetical protein
MPVVGRDLGHHVGVCVQEEPGHLRLLDRSSRPRERAEILAVVVDAAREAPAEIGRPAGDVPVSG